KIENNICQLTDEEHFHFSKVLRGREGEKICIMDGEGNLYKGEVISIGNKSTKVKLLEKETINRESPEFVIVQSITKNETMDFIIQKATEMGVDKIFPIFSKRSKYFRKELFPKKIEHWKSISINALKQSRRLYLPKINAPLLIEEFLKMQIEGEKLLFSENGSIPIKSILYQKPEAVYLLFGPEGGWEEEEETLILKHGFKSISLGKQILRTETAVISALSILNIFWRN
ncbi:MAG: 16S rRNA (uracil(1498)-N(3))-methyltransferase, partial [Candidatus Aminicenantia bacterium]